jgi:hypothetical protein
MKIRLFSAIMAAFGIAKAEEIKSTIHTFEKKLSDPEHPAGKCRAGNRRAVKGAFGKCRYRFDRHVVSDPAFNHALRPMHLARRQRIDIDTKSEIRTTNNLHNNRA